MRISEEVLAKIKNCRTRCKIALVLDCTEAAVIALIKVNKNNGVLTTHAVVEAIRADLWVKNEDILGPNILTDKRPRQINKKIVPCN